MEDLEKKDEVVEQTSEQVPNEEIQEKEEAGCLGIGASVLFPIIGFVIYFVQRNEVKNPSAYLWAACAGIVVGIILRAIAAM